MESVLPAIVSGIVVGLITGAISYWSHVYFMSPILRFKKIRGKVAMDFIYYAQVINSDDLNDEMKALFRERVLENRKSSAELSAVLLELPGFYVSRLKKKGIEIDAAAKNLIGFSNTRDYEQAARKEAFIQKKLGLPSEE